MKRVVSVVLSAVLALSGCLALIGCSSKPSKAPTLPESDKEVIIGTMPVEDILPMWVAEKEGLFEELGVNARIEVFQSAQELSVALTSGAVDMAMTDVQVATSLVAGGTPVTLEWVTLGATADQGRFGIMTSASSGYTTLADLAGVPVGIGSNTVPEYVFDRLMEAAGVPTGQIVSEEIKKLPVRYEMMASNQVAAAALPAGTLALGEANGCVLIADDTSGENISQSVMVARNDFILTDEGTAALMGVKSAWDNAALRINENPESYRSLLIEKASLSAAIADTYPIQTYPLAEYPTAAMVNPVLDWMHKKGYLTKDVVYDEKTGRLELA